MTNLLRDQNRIPVAGGVSNTDATVVLPFKIDSVTGRVLVDATTSTTTFYTDTVSGIINSSNKIFTVSNTITSALTLFLAGIPYQPTTDFTATGTTITMSAAPDVSLSGQPFWLLHT